MAGAIRSRRWHAVVIGTAAVVASVVLAACGGSSGSASSGSGSSGSSSSGGASTGTASTTSASTTSAGAKSVTTATSGGKQLFISQGCAGCHVFAAGEGSGTVGPDLDKAKPSYAEVVKQVTDGAGVMPSFKDRLSKAQIDSIAKFVATAAG